MTSLEESTEDILQSYGSSSRSSTLNEEEDEGLSLYSMSIESPKPSPPQHDLSDLYDLLEDDSIEIRRSSSVFESPKFQSSPEKGSPGKKLRNDYQDFINQMRRGSPTKKKPTNRNGNNSTDNSLNSYSVRSDSFDHFETNVDKFLADNEVHKIQKSRAQLLDVDEDKTELVMRETHKVINELPNNLFQKDEKYTQLKSSINHLIRSFENLRAENKSIRESYVSLQQKYKALNSTHSKVCNTNKSLEVENSRLQSEMDRSNREVNEQSVRENVSLKRDNALITEKLKKYKNLYVQSKTNGIENKKPDSISNHILHESNGVVSYSDNSQKPKSKETDKETEISASKDEEVNRVILQLKKILSEHGEESQKRPTSSSSEIQADKSEIWKNVKDVLQANNKVILSLADGIDTKKESNLLNADTSKLQSKMTLAENDGNGNIPIVIKCYVCHQSQDPPEKENQPPKAHRNGICKRCATVNSESSQEASDNDKGNTINVMGEYKWSI